MLNFAANLTTMFSEAPFPQRFSLAAQAGFTAVECLFPYELSPEELARLLEKNRLRLVLFNLPAGRWEEGERGITALPGREREFRDGLERALVYAQAADCPVLHAMAGLASAVTPPHLMAQTYRSNLLFAADFFAEHGIQIVVEPINRRTMPGYFLHRLAQAAEYIEQSGRANLGLQFDFFHVQMEEGCVSLKLKEYFSVIRHCQIAGVPDRHEPDTGELDSSYLFRLLEALGYRGYIGCEYIPHGNTLAGLSWLRDWQA